MPYSAWKGIPRRPRRMPRSSAADATGRRRTTPSPLCPSAPARSSRASPSPPGGWAAWTSRIRLYAEAYRLHTWTPATGEPAALVAVLLSIHTRLVGEPAQSDGWVSRAQRMLEDLPECAAHGYPLYLGTAGSDRHRPGRRRRSRPAAAGPRPAATTTRRWSPSASTSRDGSGSSRPGSPRGWPCSTRRCSPRCPTSSTPLWTGAIYCGLMDACNELRDLRRAVGVDRGHPALVRPAARWRRSTRASAGCTGPRSCSTAASGTRPSRRRWAPARTWSASTCSRSPTPTTRWARYAGSAATWTAPSRPTRQAHEYGRDPQPGHRAAPPGPGPRHAELPRRSPRPLAAGAGSRARARRRCTPRRSRSRWPPATSTWPSSRRGEVAETAETFDSAGLRAEAHRCRRRRAARPGPGRWRRSRSLRMAFNAWKQLDVPFEAARTRMLLAQAYARLRRRRRRRA